MADSWSRSLKPLRRVGALISLSALCGIALGVPGASAKVVDAEGVAVGLQERSTAFRFGSPDPSRFSNEVGHAVLPSSNVYAIYWDPNYLYHGDWEHLIDGFLHNMGAASGSADTVFSVDGQYTDAERHHADYSAAFRGAYTDTNPYPTEGNCSDPAPLEAPDAVTCLEDSQLRAELQRFISAHSLPTGMGTVYYLLTPPGVSTCLGSRGEGYCSDYSGEPLETNESYEHSFCSYHSYIGSELPDGGPSTVLYAVIPWSAGGLGDYHLTKNDQTPAYRCQDGGWNPAGTSGPEEETEPTQQEPNQEGRGPDGSFDTGLADLIVNQIAVEQQDTVTDPLLNAWQEPATGAEAVDECRDDFALTLGGAVERQEETEAGNLYNATLDGGGSYYLNDAFNLAAFKQGYPGIPCLPGVSLAPQFTTPSVVNAGEIVGFDGSESDITLDAGQGYTAAGNPFKTYPTFHWSFGDGSETSSTVPADENPVDEPAAFHSYAYGGTYTVTLDVTDTAGNTATTSQAVTVVGPPPPPPLSGGSSPASGSGSATSPGASGTSTKSPKKRASSSKPLPRPVATALVETKSLPEALSKGLLVRYSVNQQAAGQFEVLMGRKLAHRLHIKGPEARGLPKGAKRQILIALHLLVTMHKAHGALRIVIPKQIGSRLRKLHRLTLTLRLVVRNASRERPKATLVRAVVKLSR